MGIVTFERPEDGEHVEALAIRELGDVTALLVPPLQDGETSVLVGRDVDGDGVFQVAESFWLNEADAAELEFVTGFYQGATWRRTNYE